MPSYRVVISGAVQGVGYRYWLSREAARLGVSGWCRNRWDGAVEAMFYGDRERVDDLIAKCRSGPPGARVSAVDAKAADDDAEVDGFRILPDGG